MTPVTHDEAEARLMSDITQDDDCDLFGRYIKQQRAKDATIAELTRQRDEAVRVLKSVEFVLTETGWWCPCCKPACERYRDWCKHRPDCALKAAIEATEGKANG